MTTSIYPVLAPSTPMTRVINQPVEKSTLLAAYATEGFNLAYTPNNLRLYLAACGLIDDPKQRHFLMLKFGITYNTAKNWLSPRGGMHYHQWQTLTQGSHYYLYPSITDPLPTDGYQLGYSPRNFALLTQVFGWNITILATTLNLHPKTVRLWIKGNPINWIQWRKILLTIQSKGFPLFFPFACASLSAPLNPTSE